MNQKIENDEKNKKAKRRAVFLDIHSGLPREGPGSGASTTKAFSFLDLPGNPTILDVACGPGMQTIDLARLAPDATITALDILPHNVAEARKRIELESLASRVSVQQSDMRKLEFTDESFNVIWCEGAVYFVGMETALRDWSRLLKPGGFFAFTDNVWTKQDVPEEVSSWWKQHYPDMCLFSEYPGRFENSGYAEVGSFVLPASDWVDDYYAPLEKRHGQLAEKYENDPVALEVLAESKEEIVIHNKFGSYYSYAFFVLQKAG